MCVSACVKREGEKGGNGEFSEKEDLSRKTVTWYYSFFSLHHKATNVDTHQANPPGVSIVPFLKVLIFSS